MPTLPKFIKKLTKSGQDSFKEAMDHFPQSEMWRLQTDGFQQVKGPADFREKYYRGMNDGFDFIKAHYKERLSAELIEDIYKSAYRFEDDDTKNYLSGYRNEEGGGFEMTMPIGNLKMEAGVSEEGLSEFADALLKANADKSEKNFPRWEIRIEEKIGNKKEKFWRVDPSHFSSKEKLVEHLRYHLLNASDNKTENPDKDRPLTRVSIEANNLTRHELMDYVDREIELFYHNVSKIKAKKNYNPDDIIKEIVKLTRSLHQSHCFPDGNGRTFIFLMTNMLLVQQGFGLMITHTPAHFAGFSTQELVDEVKLGLKKFHDYSLSKSFIDDIKNIPILAVANNKGEDAKKIIADHLTDDPLVAIAKINELFLRIEENKISLKHGQAVRGALLDILKEMYLEQIRKALNQTAADPSEKLGYQAKTNDGKPKSAKEVLLDIMAKHDITKDPGLMAAIRIKMQLPASTAKIQAKLPVVQGIDQKEKTKPTVAPASASFNSSPVTRVEANLQDSSPPILKRSR